MKKPSPETLALAGAALLGAGLLGWQVYGSASASTDLPAPAAHSRAAPTGLDLTDTQLQAIKVAAVEDHPFTLERQAFGDIAFDDEKTVQVASPYPGKITQVFAHAGDAVKRGAPLFAVNSPDLVQAESTLIATAGTRDLTTRALARAKQLVQIQGMSQKDYEQAAAEQQAAQAAYSAARDAVRLFDIPPRDIARIIRTRAVNPVYVVRSPVSGVVTARNAAAGLVVQPGSQPAPFAVSDISTLWLVANVGENDVPLMRTGQQMDVTVNAFPGRTFSGKIANIGAAVDPNTHRFPVRADIKDPEHELRAGMLATYTIHLGDAVHSPGVPLDAVTRESDGTMSVWVTRDGHHFTRRQVTLGMQQDGLFQVLDGVQAGEQVATEGAIFLSNAYAVDAQ